MTDFLRKINDFVMKLVLPLRRLVFQGIPYEWQRVLSWFYHTLVMLWLGAELGRFLGRNFLHVNWFSHNGAFWGLVFGAVFWVGLYIIKELFIDKSQDKTDSFMDAFMPFLGATIVIIEEVYTRGFQFSVIYTVVILFATLVLRSQYSEPTEMTGV